MASKWIQKAVGDKGRLKRMVGKGPDEKLTSADIATLKARAAKMSGKAKKSLLAAIALAERFRSKEFT